MATTGVYLKVTAEPKPWVNRAVVCFAHLCAITEIIFGVRAAGRLSDVGCSLLVKYGYRISVSAV